MSLTLAMRRAGLVQACPLKNREYAPPATCPGACAYRQETVRQ
jgi:hypothetical protein